MAAQPSTPRPTARPIAGIGRVLLWKGGSLWIGRNVGQVRTHAHHAIQISLAAGQTVSLRGGNDLPWQSWAAAIVMPDRAHQFDGGGCAIANIFVEPETRAGRALIARFGQADLSSIERSVVRDHVAALHAAFATRAADDVLMAHARRIVDDLAGQGRAETPVDPRIGAALDWMREHLFGPISLAQAAAVANLSPSRFRHLFVAQTGLSFRAWLLWARVGNAVAAGMSGGSWTQAAQQAGFADSAHLTRTCRRMFGLAPTMLRRE